MADVRSLAVAVLCLSACSTPDDPAPLQTDSDTDCCPTEDSAVVPTLEDTGVVLPTGGTGDPGDTGATGGPGDTGATGSTGDTADGNTSGTDTGCCDSGDTGFSPVDTGEPPTVPTGDTAEPTDTVDTSDTAWSVEPPYVPPGLNEVEPNDTPWLAEAVTPPYDAIGQLSQGDVDCYAVDVEENGWIDATASGLDGLCPPAMIISLYAPDHTLIDALAGWGGCATFDPTVDASARYLEEGTHTLCVEGINRSPVTEYKLAIDVGDDSCGFATITPGPGQDADGDGIADFCDDDDDGDGELDVTDNCPLIPNTTTTVLESNSDGFIQHWLVLGPLWLYPADGYCEPAAWSPTEGSVAEDAAYGEDHDGDPWWHIQTDGDKVDLADLVGGPTPREVVATTWFEVDADFDGVVAVGADDGSRVWVDGTLLGGDPSCQGAAVDDNEYDVSLDAGWHQLTILVHDGGGNWAFLARIKDDLGVVQDGLPISLQGPQTHLDDQNDLDGDGIGDACDPIP